MGNLLLSIESGSSYLPASMASISSETPPIVFTLNRCAMTFRIFGVKNPGKVGPRRIFFTPMCINARSTAMAFCSY